MRISQKGWSLIVIILVLLLSIACFFYVKKIKFDYDFEAFFPNEDSELTFYQNFRDKYEYDNEFVLLSLEKKSGIFNKKFLNDVESLSKDLKATEKVIQLKLER